jgi:PAS domain S-box-containing protein
MKYRIDVPLRVINNCLSARTGEPYGRAGNEKQSDSRGRKLTGEVAVFETDEAGFITSWSVRAERLYGYDYDTMIGKHVASLFPAGELLHGTMIHELQVVAASGVYFTSGWQKRANGQEFFACSECEAIRGAGGRLCGYRKFVVETLACVN